MNYLSIIEENSTKADYVAYLRGCILLALLEDKPLDLPQFKLYADKLSEALEEEQVDEPFEKIDVYRPTVPLQIKSFDYTTVDPDEPKVQPKPKFNIGDRVIVTYNDFTGTIVRLPMADAGFSDCYVVKLDDNYSGWVGTREHDGVDCKNGWFASEKNLELINQAALEPNKWYHTTDFTVDELKELLPSGTQVEVEAEVLYNNIDTTPPTKTKRAVVENIVPSAIEHQTFIETTNDSFYKEWFKIVQED